MTPLWRARAACRGSNTRLFYPQDNGTYISLETAKSICAGCEVLDECLAEGVDNGEVGVWGGTDDAERRRLRRQTPVDRSVEDECKECGTPYKPYLTSTNQPRSTPRSTCSPECARKASGRRQAHWSQRWDRKARS